MQRTRLTNLTAATWYDYAVTQDSQIYSNRFRTPPGKHAEVRFLVYGDSETEPESVGKREPYSGAPGNSYFFDQRDGYRNNIAVMQSRRPDFIAIAGDLTESGGEQRDWDEFWKHNAGEFDDLAGSAPILAAAGNHEYYTGPGGDIYGQPGSEIAHAKYREYFENPPNGVGNAAQQERFFRVDYGSVAMLMIDSCNGDDSDSTKDSSSGPGRLVRADGCEAPDFNPGSVQYMWLSNELAKAQAECLFSFVVFHHCPYSVGPHGVVSESQSGVPLRVLTPIFQRYGVDAVLCGHDEMYERSVVPGYEVHPWGGSNVINLQVYDIGIGGDGLRSPQYANPYQAFLAHDDAPTVWNGSQLLSGGKHYGHLEVNVETNELGQWQARMTPAYVFPLVNPSGVATGYERRVYNDEVIVVATPKPTTTSTSSTTTTTTSTSTSTVTSSTTSSTSLSITTTSTSSTVAVTTATTSAAITTVLRITGAVAATGGVFSVSADWSSGVIQRVWWVDNLFQAWDSNASALMIGGLWQDTNAIGFSRFYRLTSE